MVRSRMTGGGRGDCIFVIVCEGKDSVERRMGFVVCGRGVRSEIGIVLFFLKFGSGMLRGGIGLEGGLIEGTGGATNFICGLLGRVLALLPNVVSLGL